MEIYLDSNATTPVLPCAQRAALAAMTADCANPSSTHSAGLRSRAMLAGVRATARRVLGASHGHVLFTSGATEGIHTAVLSALNALRQRRGAAEQPSLLLYGATEHKAVPQALAHWNELLGLRLQILAIPVSREGRHDLGWLRAHATRAALVCTMAANNETGVVSDLDGIARALAGSPALWLVDSVQALGKLPLRLSELPIDYAPFSGHKLFAPKGVGLLYVREGAPLTPIFTGGGQEAGLRAGTENMAGIAALGAVLSALEEGTGFQSMATLAGFRRQVVTALEEAFAGLVLNVPLEGSLPTTLNFSVPGLSSKLLLDLFDAAGLRVSGGSACSASKALPSEVLEAMGLPAWQTASAVRLSFDATADSRMILEACARIRACAEALRSNCLTPNAGDHSIPPEPVTRFNVDGACCYLVADASSRRCVVIDPLPELTEQLVQWVACRGYTLAAVLDTRSRGDHASSAQESSAQALRDALPASLRDEAVLGALGWPVGSDVIVLGSHRITRLAIPGRTDDSTAYLLHRGSTLCFAFVGDMGPLRGLERAVGSGALLLPGHDPDNRFARTLGVEAACASEEPVELSSDELARLVAEGRRPVLVDVREAFEQRLGLAPDFDAAVARQAAPLSTLVNALPGWLAQPQTPVVFFCRSGNRSAQAARALRRLGHAQAWSLDGGLALWPLTA